jgi:hypothetical protein
MTGLLTHSKQVHWKFGMMQASAFRPKSIRGKTPQKNRRVPVIFQFERFESLNKKRQNILLIE